MSAEELGKKLLGEVEEVGLDEILNTIRQNNHSQENRFGLPQLDAIIQWLAEVRVSTNKQQPTPPILELQSLHPGGGKTHLLYHLTALTVLPSALGGKQSAVIIVDTDGRFSIPRLAHQIKRQILLSLKGEPDTNSEQIQETLILSLKHVHIFSPQSLSSTIASINSLPLYLFDSTAHHSFDRTINFVALDSASAFYWQHRTDIDDAALNAKSTSQPSGYALLAASLKIATRVFNTAIIFTSWHLELVRHVASNFRPDAQSFRPSLPSPLPAIPTLRLVVHRAPVRKLPFEMSVQDAQREWEKRHKVVEMGKMECFVNEFGMEESVMQKLRAVGARFDFYITEDGIRFDTIEQTAGEVP